MNSSFVQFGLVFILSTFFFLPNAISVIMKMTSVDCKLVGDSKNFAAFEYCRLKAIRRDYSEFSAKLNLYQFPINNLTGSVQLWKRANGFKPFLYNIKYNLCKLMIYTKYPMSFEKYLFDGLRKFSNIINPPCPWNQSFISFEKVGLTPELFFLPLPSGTYRIDFKFSMDGISRVVAKMIFIREE